MELISVEEKLVLLKNILEDPEDEISREIIRLIYNHEAKVIESNSLVISASGYNTKSKS